MTLDELNAENKLLKTQIELLHEQGYFLRKRMALNDIEITKQMDAMEKSYKEHNECTFCMGECRNEM